VQLFAGQNIALRKDADLVVAVDDEHFAEARWIGGVVRELDLASFPRRVDDVAGASGGGPAERARERERARESEDRERERGGGGGVRRDASF
jgi:hypothetical protein